MTATTVQIAIQTYLQAQSIPGLNQVKRSLQMEADPAQFMGTGGAGATSYIWLVHQVETVISTGMPPAFQPNGWRQVRYDALLIFDYYVLKPSTTDDTYIDGVNTMVEGIKSALRASPNLGTYGEGGYTIFTSANQFPLDEASITVLIEPPLATDDSDFIIHGSIDWPVYENVPPAGS